MDSDEDSCFKTVKELNIEDKEEEEVYSLSHVLHPLI